MCKTAFRFVRQYSRVQRCAIIIIVMKISLLFLHVSVCLCLPLCLSLCVSLSMFVCISFSFSFSFSFCLSLPLSLSPSPSLLTVYVSAIFYDWLPTCTRMSGILTLTKNSSSDWPPAAAATESIFSPLCEASDSDIAVTPEKYN